MRIYFKKLNQRAMAPTKAHKDDAGYDLVATSQSTFYDDRLAGYTEYGTGLAVAIPKGYVGLLFPRSSVSRTNQILSNCVGVLDSGYIGEIKARFRTILDSKAESYLPPDKILQLVILELPDTQLVEVDDLDATDRGLGGFGSSGQ